MDRSASELLPEVIRKALTVPDFQGYPLAGFGLVVLFGDSERIGSYVRDGTGFGFLPAGSDDKFGFRGAFPSDREWKNLVVEFRAVVAVEQGHGDRLASAALIQFDVESGQANVEFHYGDEPNPWGLGSAAGLGGFAESLRPDPSTWD